MTAAENVAFPLRMRGLGRRARLEQAEKLDVRDDFWPEYADIIAHWNEGTVLFDQEGMRVVFSHYVLGPYSLGTVELCLDYGELAELVGSGGMERLGRAEPYGEAELE